MLHFLSVAMGATPSWQAMVLNAGIFAAVCVGCAIEKAFTKA